MAINEGRPSTTPIPDPTLLTTEQLRREVGQLRELLERLIDGNHNEIEARLSGMDKALTLFQKSIDNLPMLRSESIEHLRSLVEEKFRTIDVQFAGINTQFKERDTRTEQAYIATKVAVDAALQAQKEAVNQQNTSNAVAIDKTERSFTKQIDQIGETISAKTEGLNSKIDDVRNRLTTVEGRAVGVQDNSKKSSESWGFAFGIIGVMVGIVSIVIVIATKIAQ